MILWVQPSKSWRLSFLTCIEPPAKINPDGDAAPGLTNVGELGGVDTNKHTGSTDWIPVTMRSAWQSESPTRLVQASAGGVLLSPMFTTPIVEFDTGDLSFLSIPGADFSAIVSAVGGFQDEFNNWWFPCGSSIIFNFNGS